MESAITKERYEPSRVSGKRDECHRRKRPVGRPARRNKIPVDRYDALFPSSGEAVTSKETVQDLCPSSEAITYLAFIYREREGEIRGAWNLDEAVGGNRVEREIENKRTVGKDRVWKVLSGTLRCQCGSYQKIFSA